VDGVIVVVAQYFFVLSIALTGLVWLRLPAYRKWTLATAGLTGGLAGLGLIALAGSLYYDPRPFAVQHIHPLFTHVADNGFPSDHATLTMFLAVCVLFFSRPWGIVLAINALLVGTARVLAHVHSPLDIATGYAIGAAAAVLASWLAPVIVARIPLASTRPPSKAAPQPRHDQLTRPPG
jgi:undecaprenyl-diphosphatase